MSKEYSKALGELVSIACPKCGSDEFTFKKPIISKGNIMLHCTCSNKECMNSFTVAYKAYDVEYMNGTSKVTVGLK